MLAWNLIFLFVCNPISIRVVVKKMKEKGRKRRNERKRKKEEKQREEEVDEVLACKRTKLIDLVQYLTISANV